LTPEVDWQAKPDGQLEEDVQVWEQYFDEPKAWHRKPDPQAALDVHFFVQNPFPVLRFVKQVPGWQDECS
jgi:hypothetical protein